MHVFLRQGAEEKFSVETRLKVGVEGLIMPCLFRGLSRPITRTDLHTDMHKKSARAHMHARQMVLQICFVSSDRETTRESVIFSKGLLNTSAGQYWRNTLRLRSGEKSAGPLWALVYTVSRKVSNSNNGQMVMWGTDRVIL